MMMTFLIYTDAEETCNGRYDDCISLAEFGYDVSPDDEYDNDGDGYVECEIMIDINTWYNSQQPAFDEGGNQISGIIGGGDCVDENVFAYPGAAYLESTTECRLDETGPDGAPDGYSDCLITDCDTSVYLGEQSSISASLDFNLVYSLTGGNLVDPQAGEYELSHPFYMMTTETTQAFEKVMGYNMSYYLDPEKPVDFISHLEAFVFANLISEHVGLSEEEWCYTCTMTEGQEPCIPDEEYVFENIYECTGFRLGTEWEIKDMQHFPEPILIIGQNGIQMEMLLVDILMKMIKNLNIAIPSQTHRFSMVSTLHTCETMLGSVGSAMNQEPPVISLRSLPS